MVQLIPGKMYKRQDGKYVLCSDRTSIWGGDLLKQVGDWYYFESGKHVGKFQGMEKISSYHRHLVLHDDTNLFLED